MYLHNKIFIPYGELDVTDIKRRLNEFDDSIWDINTLRQDMHRVHNNTKSIIFKFLVDIENVNSSAYYQMWDGFKSVLEPIIETCQTFYDHDTSLNRCCLAKLPANASIPAHVDAAQSFDNVHRIHIPIYTNPQVEFVIDGERIIMDEGNAYEINNKLLHGVINKGGEDRIHLIVDLLKL